MVNDGGFSPEQPLPSLGECLNVCVEGLVPDLTASLLVGVCDVGDTAIGEGDGVLARGLSGILCTLLRLLGDLRHCRLLLRP